MQVELSQKGSRAESLDVSMPNLDRDIGSIESLHAGGDDVPFDLVRPKLPASCIVIAQHREVEAWAAATMFDLECLGRNGHPHATGLHVGLLAGPELDGTLPPFRKSEALERGSFARPKH